MAAVVPAAVALSVAASEQPRLGPQLPASVPTLTKGAQVAAAQVMVNDPSLASLGCYERSGDGGPADHE
jgi:hypothetical protein